MLRTMVKSEGQVKRVMLRRYQTEFGGRPRLLLAYADAAYASECGRYFRRLGWEVQMVANGEEARELAGDYQPNVVVLDAELLDESGWLLSARINAENSGVRVVLVANEVNDRMQDRVKTVGANQVVCRRDGAEALGMSILGKASLSEAV